MIDIELIHRELDEGDAMLRAQEELESSTAELKQAVRGGAGSPIEQRIAQAVQDQAAVSSAIQRELSGLRAQQKSLLDQIEKQNELIEQQNIALEATAKALDDAQNQLGLGAYNATQRTLEAQYEVLERMEDQGAKTIAALGRLDESAANDYKSAVDESCRRLTKCTTVAAALIIILAICGGVFALFGIYWVVVVFPGAKAFVKAHMWLPPVALVLLMIVTAAAASIRAKKRKLW